MTDKKRRVITVLKLILLILFLIGLPALLYFRYRDTLFDAEWLSALPDHLRHYSKNSLIALLLLQIIQVVICIIPGQPIQFAASYLFGVIPGLILSVAGACIGAWIAFKLARVLGNDALYLFFDKEKIDDYHRKLDSGRGLMLVLLIYLIPGIPKDLTAYAAGISDMRLRPFLLVSSIGRIPGMVGSLLLGQFYSEGNYTAIAVLAAVISVIFIVCIVKRRSLLRFMDAVEAHDKQRESVKRDTDGKEDKDR